ncbi:MAG: hypothetical protein K2Q26_16265 [Bdellovibrionales bacterium]|nr:hypothetical protein [Bdellovibrionales bacterium]
MLPKNSATHSIELSSSSTNEVKLHPWSGERVFFATKHSKEKVLAPLLGKLGLHCCVANVDTDVFGTFSGEVGRVGGVRETLRRKTSAAAELYPNARFFLSSEGSFGPHPFIGFLQSDHEALLFVDTKLNTEIYVEEISTETNHSHLEFQSGDDLHKFLHQIGFPEHGVIIKPKGRNDVVFKDLRTLQAVEQAISEAFLLTNESKVILMTDMRAHLNPTRMKVIEKVGLKLIETLNSFCPDCCSPGFAIRDGIPGLPCEDCGEPSPISKEVLWTCIQCVYTEQKERPDGVVSIPAAECDYCNP